MIEIAIQGLRDGIHNVYLECDSAEIKGAFEEFQGSIVVRARLSRFGRRMSVHALLEGNALLVCDYSLEEFTEPIRAELEMNFVFDTEMYMQREQERDDRAYDVVALHEDEHFIDITHEVMQELAVCLPLKRVAPAYRDKSVEDFIDKKYLDSSETRSGTASDSWAALKNITFDNN